MYSDSNGAFESTGTTPEGGNEAGPSHSGGYGSAPRDSQTIMRQEGGEVADLVAHARGRSDGFLYGDDRAIGALPNWAAKDSKQLYAYATVNNEPATAEELGQTWKHHGAELTRIADDLYNSITELGAVWIGQGAGAAQGALVGIANSGSQASEAAKAMQDRLAQQAAAASKLKTMPQPKEFDPGQETAKMLAVGPAAMIKDMKEQHDAAQDVKAQQIAFLTAYTDELSQIDGATPSFGPDSLGLKPLADGVGVEAGRLGAMGTHTLASGDAGTGPSGLGSMPAVAAGSGEGTTDGSGGAHGVRAQGMPVSGGSMGAGQPSAPASGGGIGAGSVLGGAAAGGALAAGIKTLASGKRSGSKKNSDPSATSASANQTGSAAAASSAGAAPAQGAQGVAPSAGGVVGATPTAAPGHSPMGMGGMGGMGAAGGRQQQEEKEHTHASFLIEPDPDETFGATESAAPPVLGAWGPEDEG